MIRAALLIALLFCAAVEARDQNVVWKFRKTHPCPSTGKVKGACPGWNVDHVIALRCGGPDTVGNMQWITVREHKAKTKREARQVPLSTEAARLWKAHGPFGLTPQQIDVHFRKGCARAGIEGLHFHDSRATAITRLAKRLDILTLARMIGHRDLKSLQVYYRETAEDTAKRLD